jgi:hypothetical protein
MVGLWAAWGLAKEKILVIVCGLFSIGADSQSELHILTHLASEWQNPNMMSNKENASRVFELFKKYMNTLHLAQLIS